MHVMNLLQPPQTSDQTVYLLQTPPSTICNGTPLTNNLLPAATPPQQQTKPVIPPLMSCIVNTPIRPAAGSNRSTSPDVTPANTSQNNTAPPTLEDLVEPTTTQTSPPRPTNDNTPTLSCPSPISKDPSTATFSTSQTSSCLRDFRQQYLTSTPIPCIRETSSSTTSTNSRRTSMNMFPPLLLMIPFFDTSSPSELSQKLKTFSNLPLDKTALNTATCDESIPNVKSWLPCSATALLSKTSRPLGKLPRPS